MIEPRMMHDFPLIGNKPAALGGVTGLFYEYFALLL
jgi:hypothetical protein